VALLLTLRAPDRSGASASQRDPAASEKLADTLDLFEHLLPSWIAFSHVRCQPLAAGRKQLVKGGTDLGIGVEVLSGDHADSPVITIGSRLIIATNGIAQTHEQGLQEKPVSGGHAESHA
jgi:hypothetical protein